jgi:hypothetical protein
MQATKIGQLIPALTMTALLGTSGAALAQQAAPGSAGAPGTGTQMQRPPQPSAPVQVDDATVSNFADAFVSVQEISEGLTEKLSEAPSAEAAQSMQREAQDEMAKTVEDNGISVEEYNEIAIGMRQDPQLAERVKAAVDEAR